MYISARQYVHHTMIQRLSVDKICIQKANLVGLSNVVRVETRFCILITISKPKMINGKHWLQWIKHTYIANV